SVTAYAEALGAVGLRRRQAVYWAGRPTLVRSPAETPVYDEAFASFWLGREVASGPGREPGTVAFDVDAHDESEDVDSGGAAQPPRRVVLLCDVSGSMEPYTRALLRFLQAAVAGRGGVEAFVFATRLTRITRHLSWRDPDAALARAGVAVADWAGGTRLGAVL